VPSSVKRVATHGRDVSRGQSSAAGVRGFDKVGATAVGGSDDLDEVSLSNRRDLNPLDGHDKCHGLPVALS
jgi:hypothetical protein